MISDAGFFYTGLTVGAGGSVMLNSLVTCQNITCTQLAATASQTKATVFAAPTATDGAPSFRKLVKADISDLGVQTQGTVFAAPANEPGDPTFRPLVCADILDLNTILQQLYTQITTPATNLLTNGSFTTPILTTNTLQYVTALNQTQLTFCLGSY